MHAGGLEYMVSLSVGISGIGGLQERNLHGEEQAEGVEASVWAGGLECAYLYGEGCRKIIIRLSWNCQFAKELYILSTLLGQRATRYSHSDTTLPRAAARKKIRSTLSSCNSPLVPPTGKAQISC